MPVLSILLALAGASAFALATVLQQGSARSTALQTGAASRRGWLPVLGILGRLLRDRRWLVGWVVNVIGFGCHVLALHLGAIAVVQAVLVLQLLGALLIAAARHSLRPKPRDWVGAVAVCSGIVTLVLLRGGVEQHVASQRAVLSYGGIAAAVIVGLVGVARLLRRRVQTRSALVAVAAGIGFSTTAAFIVVVTADISEFGLVGVFGWPLVGIVVSSTVGMLLVQDAFAGGSMPTSVTAMTITDPICSAVVGAVLFDAVPPHGLELVIGLPVAGMLVVTGVVLLANSPTLHDERHFAERSEQPAESARTPTQRGVGQPEVPGASDAWSSSSDETVRSHG
jgi:hypothetical protein